MLTLKIHKKIRVFTKLTKHFSAFFIVGDKGFTERKTFWGIIGNLNLSPPDYKSNVLISYSKDIAAILPSVMQGKANWRRAMKSTERLLYLQAANIASSVMF